MFKFSSSVGARLNSGIINKNEPSDINDPNIVIFLEWPVNILLISILLFKEFLCFNHMFDSGILFQKVNDIRLIMPIIIKNALKFNDSLSMIIYAENAPSNEPIAYNPCIKPPVMPRCNVFSNSETSA